jgi:hypothetical protein
MAITNPLFKITEPEPKPKPDQEEAESKKKYPLSVYLNEADRKAVDEIAQWSGQSRHAVLQYAIKRIIKEWRQGITPELQVERKLKP